MNVPIDGIHAESGPNRDREAVKMLMQAGVIVLDPARTYVDEGVCVAAGTVLFPGTHLRGSTRIGAGCEIGPDCWVQDSVIDSDCVIRYSFLEGARVRERSTVGPYAHLRPGADVGPEVRVGNFVEVKNARLNRGVKAGHLTYIGDAEVGEAANLGAGTITCNYDGTSKNKTVIEAGAFIGSNVALVAPVTIGEGAYVAAGSTITQDVPSAAVAFGRARQVNKDPGRSAEEDPSDDQ
jgi:bifunctional UDP-N-acetylglucosamine pyrophosphorylase / glucosamine-1-phosphate N-acetyltransferase